MGSCYITQAGLKPLGSSDPWVSSLLSSWDYRHRQPYPAPDLTFDWFKLYIMWLMSQLYYLLCDLGTIFYFFQDSALLCHPGWSAVV